MIAFVSCRTGAALVRSFLLLALFACGGEKKHAGFNPEDAVETFQVADGFTIEMIAAEPLITDPVDMEIDEYGRMYVVEMHGYPLDKSGSGKIILLSDNNGDGKMDKRTVFKEGLVLPNSIMRWKKGVLVTDSPALLYLEDTDEDGVADITDTIISGFALTNPQHNANNPVYGLDNWIYVAHEGEVSTRSYKEEFGDLGKEIVFAADTTIRLPRNANGLSIRLKPATKQLEMLSSKCQYGHTFDAWGRLFECDNSNHVYQEVIADRYFRRNKELAIASATQSLSDHLNAAEVFPITTNPDRQLLTDVGVMTSACGVTTYLGGAFPAPYDQAVFTAEPVSNLVHADQLTDTSSTFKASRMLDAKEFLASTDAWSRPVNFYVGPDGALYVLDYYRKVIESPEWMSEEAIKQGGLYDGTDKGRIYRITPTGGLPGVWMKGLKLGDASPGELVTQLSNRNYWWRINAQRLLVDRNDRTAIPSLEKALDDSSPFARLHALWTLEGLGALQNAHISKTLSDPEPGVRENAVRLAEARFEKDLSLLAAVIRLQGDTSAKVRLQTLLSLGFVNTPETNEARQNILFKDIRDKWIQVAALSSSGSQTSSLLQSVLSRYNDKEPAFATLVERLTTMVGSSGTPKNIENLISAAVKTSSYKNIAILNGLAQGMQSSDSDRRLSNTSQKLLTNLFFQSSSSASRRAALALMKAASLNDSLMLKVSLDKASKIMSDSLAPHELRADAIDFITLGDPAPYASQLKNFIDPKEEGPVQLSALRAFSKVKGTAVSEFVIQRWALLTPDTRRAAVNTFLSDSNRIALLINALEKNVIQPSSIPFGTSVQLMQNDNADLRNRARAIFTKDERDQQKLNKDYKDVLVMNGDPVNGKEVYVKNCAICHQVRGKSGIAIGPDLGTVHNWTKEDVLANILDPNMSIASGFDTWIVGLNTGESVQGIISAETPTALTLRNNAQLDRTINRQEIESIKATNTSAMPSGLEKNINKQQMADLLAFLRRNQDFN